MADPVTATMTAGGALLGGAGKLVGAFGDPGGQVPQLNPEVEAALAQQKIDIQEYEANLMAAQLGLTLPFAQDLQKYPIEATKALQNAYSTGFGKTFGSLKESMEAAAKGEDTAWVKNLLAANAEAVGRNYEQMANQRAMELGQSGLSPDSPLYQAQMAEIENLKRQAAIAGERDIRTQAQQQGAEQAFNFLKWGAEASRLPGAQLPESPQTAEDRQNAYNAYPQKLEELNQRQQSEINAIYQKYGLDPNNPRMSGGIPPQAQQEIEAVKSNYKNWLKELGPNTKPIDPNSVYTSQVEPKRERVVTQYERPDNTQISAGPEPMYMGKPASWWKEHGQSGIANNLKG